MFTTDQVKFRFFESEVSYIWFDLGVIIHLGAAAVYTEGPLLEGTLSLVTLFQIP
jgi:hypothetical protein